VHADATSHGIELPNITLVAADAHVSPAEEITPVFSGIVARSAQKVFP